MSIDSKTNHFNTLKMKTKEGQTLMDELVKLTEKYWKLVYDLQADEAMYVKHSRDMLPIHREDKLKELLTSAKVITKIYDEMDELALKTVLSEPWKWNV